MTVEGCDFLPVLDSVFEGKIVITEFHTHSNLQGRR
jgi:hypothetical protein